MIRLLAIKLLFITSLLLIYQVYGPWFALAVLAINLTVWFYANGVKVKYAWVYTLAVYLTVFTGAAAFYEFTLKLFGKYFYGLYTPTLAGLWAFFCAAICWLDYDGKSIKRPCA
jgi:hypothetical protein